MARILVVHQEPHVSELFKTILLKEGHKVDVVSYRQGLEQVKTEYGMVIVQGSLIFLHGDELVRRLECPVVMVSGGEPEFYSNLAEDSGCNEFISLPRENLAGELTKLANKFS